jgi:hypothetical protein
MGVGVGVGVPPTSGAATRVIGGSTRGESEGVGFFILQDLDLAGGDGCVPVGKSTVLAGKEELEGEGIEGEGAEEEAARIATAGPGNV